MATYSSREIVSRRIEYTVPAPWPQGAAHAELLKALAAAAGRLRAEKGIPENTVLSDDALWIRSGDDEVIISFTLETTGEHAYPAPRAQCDHRCACGHQQQDHSTHGYCNACGADCKANSGHYPGDCHEVPRG